jgi:MFS family permease
VKRPLENDLRRNMAVITVAGSLAMVYVTCVSSPLTTDFFLELGATEFDFGLLNGIPMIALVMQFLGAYLTNRVARRRPWFMALAIAARLVYLPIALLPLWLGAERPGLVTALVVLTAVSAGLANLLVPLWMSWMGDLIPRRFLNTYWGHRQRYMTEIWTVAYLGVAAFIHYAPGLSAIEAFAAIAVVGVVAGVTDILLFVNVREPHNVRVFGQDPIQAFFEPLRDRQYRSLVIFRCLFSGATMVGAAFMQIYVLKVIGMSTVMATVIWSLTGVGQAIVSPNWGRIADRFGHRPVIRLCVSLKPLICVTYLLITPATAVPVLLVMSFLDSMLNSGYAIAMNGYMLNMAPRENRSMFVASMTALAGIAAGVGAIAAGGAMEWMGDRRLSIGGWSWTNYHVIFFVSLVLRVACVPLAGMIREPASRSSRVVLSYMMGFWPMRMLTFPVGLYRRMRDPSRQANGEE